jgi:hypothetical protein
MINRNLRALDGKTPTFKGGTSQSRSAINQGDELRGEWLLWWSAIQASSAILRCYLLPPSPNCGASETETCARGNTHCLPRKLGEQVNSADTGVLV